MDLTITVKDLDIVYHLNENPVCQKFIRIMHKMKGQPVPSWTTWWRPNIAKMDMNVEWAKLKEYATICNLPISDNYDAKVLNDLHRDFHANVEPSNNVSINFAEVNTQIHLVETIASVQNNGVTNYRWTPKFGGYQYNENMHFTEPLDYTDYQYFREPTYGTLMMGYNTVGKNIGNCAFDNDIDTVKQFMVRPQVHASCEFVANLNKPSYVDIRYWRAFDSVSFTEKWVKENKLESYIDMTLPYNRVGSQFAEIGKIINPLTDDELEYVFEQQEITNICLST